MIFRNLIRFIWVALVQILIFNNIQFSGYVNPYFYVIFILLLPLATPPWLRLISSFFLGYIIDIFSQSPGLHAASSVLIAFIQPMIIRSIKASGDFDNQTETSLSKMGFSWFISYSLILIFIHHLFFFFLEVFRFTEFFDTLYRIVISTFATFTAILLAQLFIYKKSQ